jgi:peptide/nickel transport system substrate-binding protein
MEDMMKRSKIEQIIHQDTVLKQALSDPRVTRRDFLAFAGAMGLSTAMGSALWSGRALAATPKKGGHMVSGLNDANTGDSLDCGSATA